MLTPWQTGEMGKNKAHGVQQWETQCPHPERNNSISVWTRGRLHGKQLCREEPQSPGWTQTSNIPQQQKRASSILSCPRKDITSRSDDPSPSLSTGETHRVLIPGLRSQIQDRTHWSTAMTMIKGLEQMIPEKRLCEPGFRSPKKGTADGRWEWLSLTLLSGQSGKGHKLTHKTDKLH